MNITVKHKEVVAPVEKVTIELTLEEAQLLKLITNYRQRVVEAIARGERDNGRFLSFDDQREAVALLYATFRTLHDAGVHASDR